MFFALGNLSLESLYEDFQDQVYEDSNLSLLQQKGKYP
jgi:hypothetical protein